MTTHSSDSLGESNPNPQDNSRLRLGAVVGILLVGMAFAATAFWLLDRFERDRARFVFDQTAADRLVAVEQSLKFNIEVIRAVVGFYESSQQVDRAEFSSFASPALFRRRSFQALAWVPRVQDGDRASVVEDARKDGFPDFDIKQHAADGSVIVAPRRPEYFPVTFVEPILDNEQRLGLDLGHEAGLSEALSRARDSGEIIAAELAAAERSGLGGEAIFVFAPVYETGKPLDGIEFRRKFLRGFVAGLMRVGDAVDNAIEERVSIGQLRSPGLDVYLFDATSDSAAELLHARSATSGQRAPELSFGAAREGVHFGRTIVVGGREFVAVARPHDGNLGGGYIWQPWVAAFIVFSFAPLAAWFLNFVVKRREFAEALVVERTRKLRASEQALVDKAELLTLLHSIADAANQATSLEEVIRFCLDRICGYAGWPVGHAFLRESEDSQILVSSGVWYDDGATDRSEFRRVTGEMRPNVGVGLAGAVVASGRPRWLTSTEANTVLARTKVGMEVGLQVGYAFPIMVGNRAIGALEFFTDHEEEPNEELLQAWMQIGTQLGRVAERLTVDRMKGDFVSTVSHELRTPLTSIQGSLGLIRGGAVGELPIEMEKLVDIAYSNSDRLVRLINDILDIEKIESGKMEYIFNTENVAQIISDSIETNKLYADQFGVELAASDQLADVWVNGDKDRLAQVMANLLSNAAKFSPAGGKVIVSCVETNGSVRINVIDEGPGIEESFRDRIFGKFAQADSSDTKSKGGTGLGLSISKAIVEHHGGEIGYETIVGSGSTFYVVLPKINHPPAVPTITDKQGA